MKQFENARRLPAAALTLSLAILGVLPGPAQAIDGDGASTEQPAGTGETGTGTMTAPPRPMCTTFPDCPGNRRTSDNAVGGGGGDGKDYWEMLLKYLGAAQR